jgi:hypothetical protein
MKKHLLLPVLLLVSTFFFSACASDTTTDPNNNNNNNNNPTVPLGTIRVKIDGTLKTYTTSVSTFNPSDTVISVDAQDPNNIYGRFRIFIYNPSVKSFPIETGDRPGDVALIHSIVVVGEEQTFIAHSGTLKLTTFEGKHFAGTFRFTASADGTTNGTQVQGTEGEFNLNTL